MKARFMNCLVGLITAASLLVGFFGAASVHAQAYGNGPYGSCSYDSCSTVVNTQTGLQVAINLTNGQVIPLGTYTITVTPLNGQGRTFQKVEFYLDDKLMATFMPDQTGTARTDWDTTRDKGTKVKIIVYDTDGSAVPYTFNVTIATAAGVGSLPNTSGGGNNQVVAGTSPLQFLRNIIRAIPTPIAVSIPYLLLLGLLVVVVLLLWQSQREAQEVKRLRAAVERDKQLAEEKDGFIELTSHYLRTPLTLIKGGVDMLETNDPQVARSLVDGLLAATNSFGQNIESLIASITTDQRLAAIQSSSDIPPVTSLWKVWQFWAPLVGVGLVLVAMNWLLVDSGKIGLSALNVLTQLSFFVALAIGLYIGLRLRQTYRRDHAIASQQEQQQIAIDEARNNLIRQAATTLASRLDAINQFLPSMPDGDAKNLVAEGYKRIAEVLKRFQQTATVTPPVTAMPFTQFTFSDLFSHAQAAVASAAAAKQITIVPVGFEDVTFASQQPAWIVQIVTSVLDNAVAYSAEGSQVEVGGAVRGGRGEVKVSDHGLGIQPGKLAELFQPFSKAEGPMRFDHPGLGLSLYLDRLLITNLGGDIHIESQPGHGTTVTISFPLQ